MDTARVEACLLCEPPEEEEDAGAGQRPSLCVQEELGAMTAVEEWPSTREISSDGVRRAAADRDDALLATLPEAENEPLVEIYGADVEPDRFGDAKARAVEELDERAVAQRPGTGADCCVDEALRFRG